MHPDQSSTRKGQLECFHCERIFTQAELESSPGKVNVRLHGKGGSILHSAGPVHLIMTMIQLIRTSRLSMEHSFPAPERNSDVLTSGMRKDVANNPSVNVVQDPTVGYP